MLVRGRVGHGRERIGLAWEVVGLSGKEAGVENTTPDLSL